MKKGPVPLLIIFLLVILGIFAYRYDQYLLKQNYLIDAQVPCDPSQEQCFAVDCSDDDPECDTTPYKKVEMLAAEAPACLVEEGCEAFSCSTESCQITFCSDDTLEDGEVCASTE